MGHGDVLAAGTRFEALVALEVVRRKAVSAPAARACGFGK